MLAKARHLWNWLIGRPEHFTAGNRAFNSISVITLLLLLALLPFNIFLNLPAVGWMLVLAIAAQFYFYYLSRFRRIYKNSMNFYAVMSYIILTFNFFFNAGSNGPTIYLFFLTYLLLIAFTQQGFHRLWTALHIAIPTLLLIIEHYYWPEISASGYTALSYRYFDLSSCYIIIIVCIYSVTIYLRGNFEREKILADRHAQRIQAQNERIQLQNGALQQQNTEIIRLISIIAHDLRNPLNMITGVLEIMNSGVLEEQRTNQLRSELLLVSRNTSDLLNNLLSWTSRQIKGLKPSLTYVPVETIALRILEAQSILAAKKKISLRTAISPELEVIADKDMLELVIRNIVSNALKFTPENGTVQICAKPDAHFKNGIISIQDNGIGISEKHINHIFLQDVTSTYGTANEKGTGLGLFLCKEFVALQDGRIWVESVLGGGTTFYVSLPLYLAEETLPSALMTDQEQEC